MKVETLSIGLPRVLQREPREVISGIDKSPVTKRVAVDADGLRGDGQADRSVHGDQDKAVYGYAAEHYAYWQAQLGRDLRTAQFGENLTVSGLLESDVVLGSRYRVGSAELIATQPRLPCSKLGIFMGDSNFPNRFLQSGLLGIYFRVVRAGDIGAGDRFELLDKPIEAMTVATLWQLVFVDKHPPERASWALEHLHYLDDGWRRRLRAIQKDHRTL